VSTRLTKSHACWPTRALKLSASKPDRSSRRPKPSTPGGATCCARTSCRTNFVATTSSPWRVKTGQCGNAIPPGCTSERPLHRYQSERREGAACASPSGWATILLPLARGDRLAVGWQVYDPASGLFLSEGEWVALRSDLEPGDSSPVETSVELPPRAAPTGSTSLHRSAGRWHYDRGWPFLLIDARRQRRAQVAAGG